MSSLMLRAAARVLMPLLLVFATFLLLRGHNEPGGGFVAGLIVSVAFVLRMLAEGSRPARVALLVNPWSLLGVGLLIALFSASIPVALGKPFLTACWTVVGPEPWGVLVGTPLALDLGICLVVIGVVLTMAFNLAEN